MDNKVRFKIGDIEFEAEGSADIVERERDVFLNSILPVAVEAVVKTQRISQNSQYIEDTEAKMLLSLENQVYSDSNQDIVKQTIFNVDLSRTSLSSFIKNYGSISDQDFVVLAAYYDEKKNNNRSFTSDSVKQYYNDARRTKYSNNSELLRQLTIKGLIMDDPDAERKSPKQYILTNEGIAFVENYQPKEYEDKPKNPKVKKTKAKIISKYASINVDDLKLKDYPEIKRLKSFKEKMILIMYIITKENKGEWFSVSDIECLMTDILGLPATNDQISGVFKKNKSWFKSEHDSENKRAYTHKLLQGAKDFAEETISKYDK